MSLQLNIIYVMVILAFIWKKKLELSKVELERKLSGESFEYQVQLQLLRMIQCHNQRKKIRQAQL